MNYWVVIDRKKIGPLTLEETLRMPITAESYVWHRGLPTWVHAAEVKELAPMFAPAEEKAEDSAGAEQPSAPTPPPPPPYRPHPPLRPAPPVDVLPQRPCSYLGWNVASIICCCIITGIIGVIYSSRVNALYDSGQYEESLKASERAELWFIISIVVALVAFPFQLIFMLAE